MVCSRRGDFRSAGIPYQMSDALPLAAEPTSASARFDTRHGVVAFFARHADPRPALAAFSFAGEAGEVTRQSSKRAGSRALSATRYLGSRSIGWKRWRGSGAPARRVRDGRRARSRARARTADRDASGVRTARVPAGVLVRSAPDRRRRSVRFPRAPRASGNCRHAAFARRRARAAPDDPAWTIDEVGIARAPGIESGVRPGFARRRQRRAPARRPGRPATATSTMWRSSAWWIRTGRSGRGATFSIRRCSSRWGGRPEKIAEPPATRGFSIC